MQVRLIAFWDSWFYENSSHVAYERHMSGELDLGRTIPVLLHGEEGRGYKRRQLMVLSTHGALGRGSHHDTHTDSAHHLPLNMLGSTWLTHFLTCVMPISLYGDCPEAFDHMLDVVTQEFRELFYNGVVLRGVRYWIAIVGIKGDAPYLTKSGHFERSFFHRPTRASSKTANVGICHRCLAGKEDWHCPLPYEDMSIEPRWKETEGVKPAYSTPSPMMQIPYSHDPLETDKLWRFDLFHNWHSGIGKAFLGSAIIEYLVLTDRRSLETRLECLTENFQAYCKRDQKTPYYKRLLPSLFGIQTVKDQPSESWVKGDFTTLLMHWLEDSFETFLDNKTTDPMLLKIAPGPP